MATLARGKGSVIPAHFLPGLTKPPVSCKSGGQVRPVDTSGRAWGSPPSWRALPPGVAGQLAGCLNLADTEGHVVLRELKSRLLTQQIQLIPEGVYCPQSLHHASRYGEPCCFLDGPGAVWKTKAIGCWGGRANVGLGLGCVQAGDTFLQSP